MNKSKIKAVEIRRASQCIAEELQVLLEELRVEVYTLPIDDRAKHDAETKMDELFNCIEQLQ